MKKYTCSNDNKFGLKLAFSFLLVTKSQAFLQSPPKQNTNLSLNAATNSKYSQSIPFLSRPKFLTGELAGDVGFDPLNLATNKEILYEYREAEIKHSRLAMLATVGWIFSEKFDIAIANFLEQQPLILENDRVPSLFNGGMDQVSPYWWGFCVGLSAAIDLYGVSIQRQYQFQNTLSDDDIVGNFAADADVNVGDIAEEYIPGNLKFDPLNLYPKDDDKEGQKRMQLAEIKHGRLAMIAITAFSVQEFVTQIGVVDETPWFFQSFF